jgi:hypothetical protein
MGRKIWLAAVILPLSGCYVPPSGPAYAPQPGYGSPGYGYGYGAPAYGSPGYDPYSSYSYDNGEPAVIDGGVSVPLVLFGGEWGYYDHDRHFHRAPDGVSRDIENRRAFGNGRPVPGSFNPGPPGGGGQQPWHGQPNGSAAFHPGGPPPGQPLGQPPGQPLRQPLGQPPGQIPGRPFGQPSALPPRASPQPQPQERPQGPHNCPPGQHC